MQHLPALDVYKRQGEEFTLTDEFKEEVERMGGLGGLYGLYRADPWADKDEKTGIVPELSAKAYNMVQHYVMEHSRFGIPMMMSSECPHGHQALGGLSLIHIFSWQKAKSRCSGAISSAHSRS